MIIEDEIIGSQSDDDSKDSDLDAILAEFGVEKEVKEEGKKADPPIEEPKPEEKKGITVKFNKEETFIEEDKIPEYARKGLNYDKVEGRAKELQASLERAAKIAGYPDHAAYIADLDRLEQQQETSKQTELDGLRKQMLDELEEAGVNRETAEKWINSHPLIKQSEEAIAKEQEVSAKKAENDRWKPLYEAYPDINALASKGDYTWATPELLELAKRNDPLLAFEHLNKGKTIAQTKKATEQQVIKEQQLGLRSKVETTTPPDNGKQVPAALANAFAAFGLPAEAAKKYVK